MKNNERPDLVSSAPFAKVLRDYLHGAGTDTIKDVQDGIAARYLVPTRVQQFIMTGARPKITFDTADRIMCATNNVHRWVGVGHPTEDALEWASEALARDPDLADAMGWGGEFFSITPEDVELERIYLETEIQIPSMPAQTEGIGRRCARPGCSNLVVGAARAPRKGEKSKKFCSRHCMQHESRHRAGIHTTRMTTDSEGGKSSPYVCRNGHERTKENTKIRPNGTRVCRVCLQEDNRRAKQRKCDLSSPKPPSQAQCAKDLGIAAISVHYALRGKPGANQEKRALVRGYYEERGFPLDA